MDKLKQIAVSVGVSPSTVLRVLRGENKEVWAGTARRAEEIRTLAKKLGYLPNSSARAVRRGRFDCVALVLSADRHHSHLPEALFYHIHDELARHELRLLVSKLPDEKLTDEHLVPTILRHLCCDGLLINYTDHIPLAMQRMLNHYKIPSIWINTKQKTDCVYYDDINAAKAATEHLIKLGHKKIMLMHFVNEKTAQDARLHYSCDDRFTGYIAAMQEAGLTPMLRESIFGVHDSQRLEATRAILRGPDRPTAIIAYDQFAERILYAASLEKLRVPEDLSVITFSHELVSNVGANISTVLVPADIAGQTAVRMLRQKIENPQHKIPATVLPLQYYFNGTCAPLNS